MLPKAYDPKLVEETLSKRWQKSGVFKAEIDANKKPFTIVIPPPNITGALHMGHGLNNTLQDMLIRYRRMNGQPAAWVPGVDHGGIATQNVVEKALAKDKKLTRHDLGREEFVNHVWRWYKECGNTIFTQFEKMGWALDQSDIRFTMDDKRAQAVYAAFKKLWEKKYIYRGKRLINWCVRCSTALSDIEVEHEQRSGALWYLQYKGQDGGEGITIATTRPETIFADAAVAVNPRDERYTNLIGAKVIIPLTNRAIPVIADEAVQKDFGTGALKITPAHDPVDYEVGSRHNLEQISVITDKGKMTNVPQKYMGLPASEARKQVAQDAREAGLLVKEEKYVNAVSTCYRCNSPIEPFLSEQWFVKMDGLAKPAVNAINEGKVNFHPQSWKQQELRWLENIQDWCISRQIWWGHRIPVWYCRKCSAKGLTFATDKQGKEQLTKVSFEDGAQPIVSFARPACPHCAGADTLQDPDVLDTWFSSALWPFSVFGWPQETPELKYYYPTSILVTGYEIIYLWVARMIMMGLEFMGEAPFKDVLLNGIVRDKTGKKMSKSLGNVIDPLDLIQKYGADAVRFSLITQAAPGKDIPYGEDAIVGARNFCNKIYNASRFIQMNMEGIEGRLTLPETAEELCDKWIISRYNKAVQAAREAIARYDMAAAADTLYHFLWGDFCDWYIELAKARFAGKDKEHVISILVNVLYGTLKALHPLMPFITEEIAQSFKKFTGETGEFLLQQAYPAFDVSRIDDEAEKQMQLLQGITAQIRAKRAQLNVPPSMKIKVILFVQEPEQQNIITQYESYITSLAKVNELVSGQTISKPAKCASAAFQGIAIYIPLEGLIDIEKEKARLKKEIAVRETGISNRSKMLNNESFIKNATEEKINLIRTELHEMQLDKEAFQNSLEELG
ncbi:MAG: valine--tRNA ligase [Elusimicrobiota bacterium]|jgi:valyl-tRNA synthetase|nr:valine--tRNA ligase [Elusimicrobiota bacterium]